MECTLIRLRHVAVLLLAAPLLGCESDPPRPVPPPPIVVNPDGSGDYPTIQAAIDSADVGDVIELADGVFRGEGNRDIDFRGKNVTVRSKNGDPSTCIIDCEADSLNPHRAFHFHSGEDRVARIEGVTITGGHARGAGMGNCGGAVLCVGSSSPTFESCWFLRNASRGMGGAVQCGSAPGSDTGCAPRFKFCLFADNSGPNGGAIAAWAAGPTIENCTFVHNTATTAGGAIDYYSVLQVDIVHTIIAFNSGTCAVLIAASGDAPLSCCDVFGNQGGDWTGPIGYWQHAYGNISADPLFVDAGAGNYRLHPESPCCPDSSACGLMGALPAGCR